MPVTNTGPSAHSFLVFYCTLAWSTSSRQIVCQSDLQIAVTITHNNMLIFAEAAKPIIQDSNFLSLPFEIRDLIYDFVFSNMVLKPKIKFHSTRIITILHVCKMTYYEARNVAKRLSLPCLRFIILDDAYNQLSSMPSLKVNNLRRLRLPLGIMKSPYLKDQPQPIYSSLDGFFKLLPDLKLEELLLDVSPSRTRSVVPSHAFYFAQQFVLQNKSWKIVKLLIARSTEIWSGEKQPAWPSTWNARFKACAQKGCHASVNVYFTKTLDLLPAENLLYEDENSKAFQSNVHKFEDTLFIRRKARPLILIANRGG